MIIDDVLKARLEKMEVELAQLRKRCDELHDVVHLIRSDLATAKLSATGSVVEIKGPNGEPVKVING